MFTDDKPGLARALGEAFCQFGFVALHDHGVPDALIAANYETMTAFFALPDEVKRRYHNPANGGQGGYTPFGLEGAKDRHLGDLKEFWHTGRTLPASHPLHDWMAETPEVAEVPDFNANARTLFSALDSVGQTVLAALALYLGEEERFFRSRTDVGDSKLRLLHYPPIMDLATPALRAGPHEDINLITLLVGSGEPGLEVQTREGTWIAVDTIPGTIICNIGDMLQRLTNDVLPSTTHRVVNPVGEARLISRYSSPYFLHLNADAVIAPLPHCVSPANPRRYPPITARDYLQVRLFEIGLIPELPERLAAEVSKAAPAGAKRI
jgi:isopenicillin N synthase-like dioxygenase